MTRYLTFLGKQTAGTGITAFGLASPFREQDYISSDRGNMNVISAFFILKLIKMMAIRVRLSLTSCGQQVTKTIDCVFRIGPRVLDL